ncbi:MAG: zinc-ribbon domain-containing protein, partial [Prevotellaceae bacterium]|nr:zinc-ribbon domain-containing protein [Prevotellaceae bacterium]
MAIVKCSECGKEVSDKATSCPNCGAPLQTVIQAPTQTVEKEKIIVVNNSSSNGCGIAGFVFAILGLFLGWIPVLGWIIWFIGLILCFIGLFKTPRTMAIVGLFITFIEVFIIL